MAVLSVSFNEEAENYSFVSLARVSETEISEFIIINLSYFLLALLLISLLILLHGVEKRLSSSIFGVCVFCL